MGLLRRHTGKTPAGQPDPSHPQAGQQGGAAEAGAAKSGRGPSWMIKLTAHTTFAAGLGCALWLAGMLIYYTIVFPDPLSVRAGDRAPIIRIVARDGTLLAKRGAAHDYMPLDMVPKHVIDAVVATEDRRFFDHWGIDPIGLMRAAFANLRAGRFVQGGSTLTQQLAKNLFLSSERTMSRKLDELALAIWLEVRLSKRDILELYLNRVYFGGGAYGIEAAAQRYFDKSVRALSVTEAALIAGLLKAPSKYAPTTSEQAAMARAQVVLARMRDAGVLAMAAYDLAMREKMRFADLKGPKSVTGFEYAIDLALERLPPILGSEYTEMIVETTIDASLQRHADQAVRSLLDSKGKAMRASQAALVTLDHDGGIRALVGGRSYAESQFNRATKARRQPGSVFKPFVYLTALERGVSPDTITYDLPLTIGGWSPRNDNNRHVGAISVRQALAKSVNSVAVRLTNEVGLRAVINTSRRLGIQSELREDLSIALGTSELTLIELAGAYSVLGRGGEIAEPYIIRRVRLNTGRVLYAHGATARKSVVSLANVGAMNDMLNEAMVSGTGRQAALPSHPAAGKTGTTQDFRDAWFVGYTAHMTTGVWIGNDDSTSMNRVMGGTLPAQIWRAVMLEAHRDLTPAALPGTTPLDGVAGAQAASPVIEASRQNASPPATIRAVDLSQMLTPGPQPQSLDTVRKILAPSATTGLSSGRSTYSGRSAEKADRPANGQRLAVEPPTANAAPLRSHPSERISEDFLARVLAEPDAVSGNAAATATAFDPEAIRRQLDVLPDAERRRDALPGGLMALGAGR